MYVRFHNWEVSLKNHYIGTVVFISGKYNENHCVGTVGPCLGGIIEHRYMFSGLNLGSALCITIGILALFYI